MNSQILIYIFLCKFDFYQDFVGCFGLHGDLCNLSQIALLGRTLLVWPGQSISQLFAAEGRGWKASPKVLSKSQPVGWKKLLMER